MVPIQIEVVFTLHALFKNSCNSKSVEHVHANKDDVQDSERPSQIKKNAINEHALQMDRQMNGRTDEVTHRFT